MTISKAQGQTFSNVLIDLQKMFSVMGSYTLQFYESGLGMD